MQGILAAIRREYQNIPWAIIQTALDGIIRDITDVKMQVYICFLNIIPASLQLSEAEHNERGVMQFLCRKFTFYVFQCRGLGRDPTAFISVVFMPFFTCFLGAVQTCSRKNFSLNSHLS